MTTTKVRSDQMFPCFVGFWASIDQREKLERMAQNTHRKLGEVMRLLRFCRKFLCVERLR
jgi:hypothetical protein